MKCKVTKPSVKKNYCHIISIGYCDAQYILKAKDPFGYSSNVYGWACDYYDLTDSYKNYCISTGYSTIGKSLDGIGKLCEKYNNLYQKEVDRFMHEPTDKGTYHTRYKNHRKRTSKLYDRFCNELVKLYRSQYDMHGNRIKPASKKAK